LRLYEVAVTSFFKIAEAAGVVHGLHLDFGVRAFLTGAEAGITDIGSKNLQLPGRRDERLGRRHVKGERIAQVVVGQSITDEDGNGISLLTGGATRAPDAQGPIAAFLLLVKELFENGFLQEIELWTIAKETGFVDGEILEKESELGFALAAGEQAVVAIKGFQLSGLQAALETVLEEMRAAFVEEHAAFLIDEGLQKLEFGFSELHLRCERSHIGCVRQSGGADAVRRGRWRPFPRPPRDDGFPDDAKAWQCRAG